MILYLCHIYIIIYPHLKNSLHSAPRSPQHFSQVALKPQVIVVNKVDLPEVQAGLGDAEDGTRMDYTNHIHIYIYIIIYMYIYIYYNIIYTYADIHVFLIYKYQDYGHTTDISGYITSINEYGATYHHGSIWPIFAYQRHPETLNLHGSGGNDRILSSSWRSTVNSFAISQHFSIPNRFKPSTA